VPTRSVSRDDLARLKAAREEADAAYNAALSALDAALPAWPALPHPPPAPDEAQITPLNQQYDLLQGFELPGGLKGRLVRLVWGVLQPVLSRQQAFNAALVDHVNRAVPVERATRASIESVIDALRIEREKLGTFHSALVVYLQQLTPFVDTKDQEFNGLATRRTEDVAEALETLHHRTVGPGGAISGVGDELNKRLEALATRERRFDARVAALNAAHEQLAHSLAVVSRATQTLKREVERLAAPPGATARDGSPHVTGRDSSSHATGRDGSSHATGRDGSPHATGRDGSPSRPIATHAPYDSFATGGIDSFKYVGFEDRFRGSPEAIRQRLLDYAPLFAGQQDVLDIGCGRGEFLEILRQHGVDARGLDINHEMVEVCRQRGLDATEGDALAHLSALPDESLGGIFAAQVVEHLEPAYLVALLQHAYHALRPGGLLVLETINVACWFAFFQSYILDITHVRPLHPETLSYFVRASGFPHVDVQFRAPYPPEHKLQHVAGSDPLHYTLNANVDTLNSLLFTHLDYAVVARRP
jgi:SAM-dependent methyltransferase